MASIHDFIAAISPDTYCEKEIRDKIKKIVKEKGYKEAAESKDPKIKIVSSQEFDLENAKLDVLKAPGLKAPIQASKLIYDSSAEALEPIYFWIIDYTKNFFKKISKINSIK